MKKGILLIPDNDEEEQKIIQFWTGYKTNNTSQSTLTNNKTDPNTCSKCGVDIFEKYPEDEAKKIINYCKFKYKKTLCKDCQEGEQ